MSTNTSHDEIVVFREDGRTDHVFHLLARSSAHDKTICGRALGTAGARLPRFVADVAGYHVCGSCLRLQHVFGEAGALLQRPAGNDC